MNGFMTDRAAFAWLTNHGHAVGEFENWMRYVREGRRHFEDNKNRTASGQKADSSRELVAASQSTCQLQQVSRRVSQSDAL